MASPELKLYIRKSSDVLDMSAGYGQVNELGVNISRFKHF